MKTKQKMMILLMTSILLFLSIFTVQPVKAYTELVDTATLFSTKETYVDYEGSPIEVEVIQYKLFGANEPVYCLDKNKSTLNHSQTYTLAVEGLLNDMNVWRTITNGYPFKDISNDLNCNTVNEAYVATQIAIYDSIYHFDLTKFTPHSSSNSSHVNTVNALKQIITAARASTESKVVATASIQAQNDEWQVDTKNSNYISKTYYLNTSTLNLSFEVSLSGNGSEKAILTDAWGNERTSFNSREKFIVKMPIQELNEGGIFNIQVTTDLRTFPIFYANQNGQEFAITMGYYEPIVVSKQDMYDTNQTAIDIFVKNGDTEEPLTNATFQIANSNGQVIYSDVTTNAQGKAIIKKVLPGTYYLKQVKTPEGYYGYESEKQFTVTWNQKCNITVDNFALPTTEYQPKPQDQTSVTASEKKDIQILPRAGC